jgi:hypothetical protein
MPNEAFHRRRTAANLFAEEAGFPISTKVARPEALKVPPLLRAFSDRDFPTFAASFKLSAAVSK